MARQNIVLRYRCIINKLSSKPSSFEEIQDHLQRQEELTEDELVCSQRTLQRDIKNIARLYDIEIANDRSTGKYHIVEDARDKHSERLMETFDLQNAIKVSNSFGNHLIFEKRRGLGTDLLHACLHGIKHRLELNFSYHKFYDNSESKRMVQPLTIKESRHRWYLLARDTKDGKTKSFGLDRVSKLEISNRRFERPVDYDPEKEYRYAFGVINATGEKPEEIELAFTAREARYVKSLPLHHSQEVIKEGHEETHFRYKLAPTYDFRMEILSYGDQVRVVSPLSLQKEIREMLSAALGRYE